MYQGGKERGGIQQPFHGTWVADFIPRIMLRQDTGKFVLEKYLSTGLTNFIGQRRRLEMSVAGITPTASQLTQLKIGKM